MAFEKVTLTNAITLGGRDKNTGHPNPTKIEGYLLRTREVGPNKFNRAKMDYVHDFLSKELGEISVWGKTNLDSQLRRVNPGTMVRVSLGGTRDTGKGNPMQCYLVEQDTSNTIDVAGAAVASEDTAEYDSFDESNPGEDEPLPDEIPPSRAAVRKSPPLASSASQQKVKDLLAKRVPKAS